MISAVPSLASVDRLCRLLQGETPAHLDWAAILAVANLALVTPRLEPHLKRVRAPQDVQDFVSDVARRNRLRNAGLVRTLGDAARALNGAGILPVVLKGGACLARWGHDHPRITSDIDLVVPPETKQAALAALKAAGFTISAGDLPLGDHAFATAARAVDPGQLDLHHRPPGPAGLMPQRDEFLSGPLHEVGQGLLRTPDPHIHIYLQILHDQLHDGGYWRGALDLRHAWDVADLVKSEVINWRALQKLPPTRLLLDMMAVQLQVCRHVTGAIVPLHWPGRRIRLQALRQRLQYAAPALRAPLAALTVLSHVRTLPEHRRVVRQRNLAVGLTSQEGDVQGSYRRLLEHLRLEIGGRL